MAHNRFRPTVLPPLAAFVAAGGIAQPIADDRIDLGLTLWFAVVGWPIGLLLLCLPTLVLVNIRTPHLWRLGQVLVGLVGVFSIVAVSFDEDAQAGMWFIYIPFLGSLLAAGLLAVDRIVRRGPG